jgi:hypothetical protein
LPLVLDQVLVGVVRYPSADRRVSEHLSCFHGWPAAEDAPRARWPGT